MALASFLLRIGCYGMGGNMLDLPLSQTNTDPLVCFAHCDGIHRELYLFWAVIYALSPSTQFYFTGGGWVWRESAY